MWLLFQISVVQTFLAQQAAAYMGSQLGNTVKIERLEIDFFNSVNLNKVYVSDQNGDTLLSVDEFQLTLGMFNIKKRAIDLEVELLKPYFNLSRAATSENYNHKFFFNYFIAADTTESENNWELKVRKLNISSGEFHFHDYHMPDTTTKVNYSHVDLYDLDLDVSLANLKGNNLYAEISHLSAREANGFYLKHLKTELRIEKEIMDFQNTKLQTLGSDLEFDLRFSANSFNDYQNFIELVDITADFKKSIVHMDDVAFFAPPLDGIQDQFFLDGKVKGTIDNLSGTDIELHLNKETVLFGDFDFRGLPDVENTFIHFDMKRFKTTAEGIRELPYPPFNEKSSLIIPENIGRLGELSFKGKFTGYYNDFVAFGTIVSNLGSVKMDMAVKEREAQFYYEGEVKSSGFELGQFLDVKQIGLVALNLKLDGSGLTKEKVNARAKGTINTFELKGYSYKDIELNAAFSKQTFDGKLSITDENIKFDFNGSIDARKDLLFSDFSIKIDSAKLAKLNLFNVEDSLTQLSFVGDINLIGLDFDEVEGALYLNSIKYSDYDHDFVIDSVNLIAEKYDGSRHLKLASDIAKARFDGNFQLNKLRIAAKNMLANYFKEEVLEEETALQDFSYNINIINFLPVTEMFIPDLKVDSNTLIQGSFNNRKKELALRLQGRKISYQSTKLSGYQLDLNSNGKNMEASLNVVTLKPIGISDFDSVRLGVSIIEGDVNLQTSWESLNGNADAGNLEILSTFKTFDKIDFRFRNSHFNLKGEKWRIGARNRFSIERDSILIDSFRIENRAQYLAINGIVSNNPKDSLKIELHKLNLTYLSQMLPKGAIRVKGVSNGEMLFKDFYNNLSVTSNLQFDSLEVNTIKIGKGYFESKWNDDQKELLVDGKVGEGEQNILSFEGKVFPLKTKESLDLKLKMNQFPLYIVSPYIEDYLSDIEGHASGEVSVKGEASKPLLRGKLQLNDAGVTVNLLQTHYSLNNEIIIEPDFVGFNHMKIIDKNGSEAIATGTVFHNNYSDFSLDIGLEYENFMALNTTSYDNDLYYGVAICSGNANISGFGDQFIININAKAQKGTNFKIPLDEGVEVTSSDFLIFTNSTEEDLSAQDAVDLSGIQLNFDLEIEKDAKVQIIFDEKIGDILEANGEGNLKLEINTLGNFNIFGQYIITNGEYLFTLKNVVNKRFSLARGSRISWDGDPYKARLDMQAIYNLRASLVDIMGQDSTANFKRRVPVELELQMKGFLLSPEITFDIRLPSADDEIRRRLESILYLNSSDVNQQEMNQQVFGLLVFNRFMTPSTGRAAESGVSRSASGINNGYEFLSNQMSNWLSQVSDQFDVGVNYRQGDEYAGNEFDLSLSTELFEDRLVLDGNLGYTSDAEYVESQDRASFIGEFSLEYMLSKDGRFRLKGFNRSTNNSLLETNSPYTQGVGLFYREEFDTFKELWRRYFRNEAKGRKE